MSVFIFIFVKLLFVGSNLGGGTDTLNTISSRASTTQDIEEVIAARVDCPTKRSVRFILSFRVEDRGVYFWLASKGQILGMLEIFESRHNG